MNLIESGNVNYGPSDFLVHQRVNTIYINKDVLNVLKGNFIWFKRSIKTTLRYKLIANGITTKKSVSCVQCTAKEGPNAVYFMSILRVFKPQNYDEDDHDICFRRMNGKPWEFATVVFVVPLFFFPRGKNDSRNFNPQECQA